MPLQRVPDGGSSGRPLYRPLELAWRTAYAELKERVRGEGPLLPGTPGTLYVRQGTGRAYAYRVYYTAPGQQAEDLVGQAADVEAQAAMQARIEAAQWASEQVAQLRKLGFQVADKPVARVLVELHNRGLFASGLVLTGTLAYMAWLNELGATAVAARTMDIDLARRQALKLAAPVSFLEMLRATRLPFVAVPGMPSHVPATSFKLPGRDGLRVDLLAPGRSVGATLAAPELDGHAQTIPHYAWLLEAPDEAVLLAGGHAVPVRLPQAVRLMWHKLYASGQRKGEPEKAAKDLRQAATLAAILTEVGSEDPRPSLASAAAGFASAVRRQWPALRPHLAAHPQARDALERALA